MPNMPMDVLIVEDDEVDVKNIKQEFLKLSADFNFYVATDGVDAMNKLYGKKGEAKLPRSPHLIIVDIHMPKMDGNELVRLLREDQNFNHVPIFVLTNTYTSDDKLATSNMKVEHIVKPLGANEVLHMYMTALKLPGFQTPERV